MCIFECNTNSSYVRLCKTIYESNGNNCNERFEFTSTDLIGRPIRVSLLVFVVSLFQFFGTGLLVFSSFPLVSLHHGHVLIQQPLLVQGVFYVHDHVCASMGPAVLNLEQFEILISSRLLMRCIKPTLIRDSNSI